MVGARSYTPFGRVEQATGALAAMGYTAMGDRLWQATAGITTTYTLDQMCIRDRLWEDFLIQ